MQNYLEHRINKLLAEAEQLWLNLYSYQARSAEYEVEASNVDIPEWVLDGLDEFDKPFKLTCLSLHESIICYLDQKHLNNYLHLYNETVGKSFGERNLSLYTVEDRWSNYPYNDWLQEVARFLRVFEFSSADNERYVHIIGLKYLESILQNSATIVFHSGIKPSKETEVTNIIRPIINAVFPSSRNAGSNFLKTAKEYIPDLLIPEIHAAVEFKYAADATRLKSCIDSIFADFAGYTGDKDYRIFYVVFYLTCDFWGREKFFETWKDTGFPPNWRAFYVVGPWYGPATPLTPPGPALHAVSPQTSTTAASAAT